MRRFPAIPAFSALFLAACLNGAAAPQAHAADCNAVARQAERETGGQAIRVNEKREAGGVVCIIKMNVPGSGGQRPRVRTLRIPAN
jgi:hypothetical protein